MIEVKRWECPNCGWSEYPDAIGVPMRVSDDPEQRPEHFCSECQIHADEFIQMELVSQGAVE